MLTVSDLSPRPVKLEDLNESSIGRNVMYLEDWENTNVKFEHGVITKFNDRYVFVDFTGNGYGVACSPKKMLFTPKAQSFCGGLMEYQK
jgi:hypothetical protein